jgi:hypothetical protein
MLSGISGVGTGGQIVELLTQGGRTDNSNGLEMEMGVKLSILGETGLTLLLRSDSVILPIRYHLIENPKPYNSS